jgi:D-xylose 1-dehydrogenase (NADP+, D-xylono-1,5-lactone-forming)
MTIPPLRWGILGAARITRSLVPAFQAASGQQLVGVASRSPDKGRAFAAQWGVPQTFDGYEALLASREIDAVYIPLPNHLHAEWTVRAAEAGKHVLCEKPLALTASEVDTIAAAAARAGVHVAEAFMYRHHPQTQLVKQLVADGAIGELRLVRSAFSFMLDRPGDVRFEAAMGGGSLRDVGCYPVSFARYLAGTEPVEVSGRATIGPTGVDLSFAGWLRFSPQLHALIDCSFIQPFRTDLEVVGAEGVIRVLRPFKPDTSEVVVVQRRDGGSTEHPVTSSLLYVGEIEDFARVVGGQMAPRVTLADSRGNVATLAALLASAASPQA